MDQRQCILDQSLAHARASRTERPEDLVGGDIDDKENDTLTFEVEGGEG
jgi:hypothetical protein